MNLKNYIRTIEDYPKPGILFKDITSLLKEPRAFSYCIDELCKRYADKKLDAIVAIESRGFFFGSSLAYKLQLPLIPIRKKGKLPSKVYRQSYQLEYATDEIEVHCDSLSTGDRIIIIDDLLATGGTMLAAINLLKPFNPQIEECSFIVNLPILGGEEALDKNQVKSFNLVSY